MAKHNDDSNDILKQLIEQTANPKIIHANHNLPNQGFTKDQVFGTQYQKTDRIHMNGDKGKIAITASFKNLFQQAKIKMTLN